ncbi:Ulp1 protease family [Forsythia ovata]|uniref:Ulp1 protease family n=1 Tax=Forsythia ovata TaxID=205694 RepID=A0ABD1T945_9LAMI
MRLKLSISNRISATCTDCYSYDSKSADKLTPLLIYPNGKNNRFNSNWEEVDRVFIPVFMDKKAHWILVDLDIANWHLYVYNSSFKTIRDVDVLDIVEPLHQMIQEKSIICLINIAKGWV